MRNIHRTQGSDTFLLPTGLSTAANRKTMALQEQDKNVSALILSTGSMTNQTLIKFTQIINLMKINNQSIKVLATLLILVAGMLGAKAQTDDNLTQQVCPGTEPYLVTPGNVNNTFSWTINSGVSGTDWTISDPDKASTNIVWTNPLTPQVYVVTFKEIDPLTSCFDEVTVEVTVNPAPVLTITDPPAVCLPNTIDLTLAAVTAGSILPTGTVLSYWTDATATTALTSPEAVSSSGTYYIKAETLAGCTDIKPINVIVNEVPILVITDPNGVCMPNTVDLTSSAVTTGSTMPTGTILTYWSDAAASIALASPEAVSVSGTYYIKAEAPGTCSDIKAVNVVVNEIPVLAITDPAPVCLPNTVDLTLTAVTTGSTMPTGTILTYWSDAAASIALASPEAVSVSGTYYIKAETPGTCTDIKSVNVVVNEVPILVIIDPLPACLPNTVDLTSAAVTAGSTLPAGTVFSYWTDAALTTALTSPEAVSISGTYYIKAEAPGGCSDSKPVNVVVNEAPILTITNPDGICIPNTVDLTSAAITAGSTIPTGTVLTYWTDAAATTALTSPEAVSTSGTYYIKAETPIGCNDIKAVDVIINPVPVTSRIMHR